MFPHRDGYWPSAGLARRLGFMAAHGDHLTVGERNVCAAAADRVMSDPEQCDHRSTWSDLTGSGTISCKDCGTVLFNRYGPDGDKLPGGSE